MQASRISGDHCRWRRRSKKKNKNKKWDEGTKCTSTYSCDGTYTFWHSRAHSAASNHLSIFLRLLSFCISASTWGENVFHLLIHLPWLHLPVCHVLTPPRCVHVQFSCLLQQRGESPCCHNSCCHGSSTGQSTHLIHPFGRPPTRYCVLCLIYATFEMAITITIQLVLFVKQTNHRSARKCHMSKLRTQVSRD